MELQRLLDPLNIVIAAIVAGIILSFIRVVRGPSLPDRVVALDLVMVLVVSFIGVYTVLSDQPVYLDAALVMALVAFVGTVAFARYLERRARDE